MTLNSKQIDACNAWHNKGSALAKLGKHQEAIECYDKALEIDPTYVLSWLNKATSFCTLGNTSEGIECYDKAFRGNLMGDADKCWYDVGMMFLQDLGKFNEAIECFDRSLRIEPNNSLAWNNIGIILHNFEKYNEALECYDRALGIDPNNMQLLKNKQYTLNELEKRK